MLPLLAAAGLGAENLLLRNCCSWCHVAAAADGVAKQLLSHWLMLS
jgi:hypothetical protein